jgi:lactate dehydrogenase-like 2-hydroxyacid dehydrogenase
VDKPRLVVSRQMPEAVQARIAAEFEAPYPGDRDLDAEEVLRLLEQTGAEALMLSSHLKLDAATIASLPARLRVAATTSVGYDHIDVAAARAKNLIVTNTPDVLTDCTADLTMLLILAACRRAHEDDALMRAGWRRSLGLGDMLGIKVTGKTLGIIGMGRIGRAVAQRARGFGMPIVYSSPHRLPPELEQGASYFADFHAMLPHCQVLTLHAPGGAATDRLMDAAAFAALPPRAVFVNASRGSLVDEDALLAALQSGHLFAAGLDVFRSEPGFDERLAALPNVFLTPHIGSATVETRNAMGFRALDNIAAVLGGRPPVDPLWR